MLSYLLSAVRWVLKDWRVHYNPQLSTAPSPVTRVPLDVASDWQLLSFSTVVCHLPSSTVLPSVWITLPISGDLSRWLVFDCRRVIAWPAFISWPFFWLRSAEHLQSLGLYLLLWLGVSQPLFYIQRERNVGDCFGCFPFASTVSHLWSAPCPSLLRTSCGISSVSTFRIVRVV